MKKRYLGLLWVVGLSLLLCGGVSAKTPQRKGYQAKKVQSRIPTKRIQRTKKPSRRVLSREAPLPMIPRRNIYVHGLRGDDGNNGFSWENAKKTIQAGIDATPAGKTCYVAGVDSDGTSIIYSPDTYYGERFYISMKSDIVLKGLGYPQIYYVNYIQIGDEIINRGTVLECWGIENSRIEGLSITGCYIAAIDITNSTNITVCKNKITTIEQYWSPDCDYLTRSFGIRLSSGCRDNKILENSIAHCDSGIYQHYNEQIAERGGRPYLFPPEPTETTIRGNIVHNCWAGIGLKSPSNKADKNLIIDNDYGIRIFCHENAITNNTLYKNVTGIYVHQRILMAWFSPDDVPGFIPIFRDDHIINNIIISGEKGIASDYAFSAWDEVIRYNDIWDNNIGNYVDEGDSGLTDLDEINGNISYDPFFVAPWDTNFKLLIDSPCIDAGDPESPRDPDYTRADMGAFYRFQFGSVDPSILFPPSQ